MPTHSHARARLGLAGVVLAGLVWLCLALAASAPADTATQPVVNLGPVTVANGTATLAGNVGGTPTAGLNLSVNGQPVSLDAAGNFTGVVDLAGQSQLTLSLKNPLTGELSTIDIPLSTNVLGPGGVIPSTVLDALRNAGITLTLPPDGFKIVDGLPLTVVGGVLNKDTLSSLKVNGIDVLGLLKPDGTFSQSIPGTSREVTVAATDRNGVTQTSSFGIDRLSSLIQTQQGTSVSAAGADGVKIAKIRYVTKGVKARKRVQMIVTIKDKRGYLVRDAKVRVRAANFQRRMVVGGQQARLTGKVGTASFVLRLRPTKFTKSRRLFTVTTAITPKAQAKKTTSVRVPKLRTAVRRTAAHRH